MPEYAEITGLVVRTPSGKIAFATHAGADLCRMLLNAAHEAGKAAANGCPCKHTTPCTSKCSCVVRGSSHGCRRCCRYGNEEQRKARAERLASKIGASAWPNWRKASEPPDNNRNVLVYSGVDTHRLSHGRYERGKFEGWVSLVKPVTHWCELPPGPEVDQ